VLSLGHIALVLSLVLSLASVLFLVLGVRQHSRALIRQGYLAVFLFFISVAVAGAALLTGFLNRDYSFRYVAENTDSSLGVFYRIAGFWAGKEGSFLFWLALLALVTVIIAMRDVDESDRLTATAVAVLCSVCAFFAVLMVFDDGSNPFAAAEAGATGAGLNPLLLHPAMVLHPPALFAGYAWLAVPFAFAIAALVLGRTDRDWVVRANKWAVGGWAFLSLGIGLGAWWAYVVLSWGGYWGWDPVENTSLIPWLTATALLHSMTLYRRRGVFKHWTLGLAMATFWLTIVATWVTRSGVIQSVHAFEENAFLDTLFKIVMLAVAALAVGLLSWRWRRFAADKEFESLASRDFMYYLNNLVLSGFALAVLFATVVVPLVFKKTVGPEAYQRIAEPVGVIMLAGIAICPLFGWGRTEGRTFWRNARFPALVAGLSLPLLVLTGGWHRSLGGLIGLVVCFFAGASVLRFVVVSARRGGEGGALAGLRRGLLGSRSRSGAYVAHFGMVLILAGLLGSSVYKLQTTPYIDAKPGAEASVGDYTVRFVDFEQGNGPQASVRDYIVLDVFKSGKKIGQVKPHFDSYPDNPMGQTAARAVILNRFGEDLFVAPTSMDEKSIGLQLDVFPLITLVWVGSVMLVLGAVVSLWPKRRRVAAPLDDEEAPTPEDEAA